MQKDRVRNCLQQFCINSVTFSLSASLGHRKSLISLLLLSNKPLSSGRDIDLRAKRDNPYKKQNLNPGTSVSCGAAIWSAFVLILGVAVVNRVKQNFCNRRIITSVVEYLSESNRGKLWSNNKEIPILERSWIIKIFLCDP